MDSITFKTLKDDEVVLVNSFELFLDKRILLCSITEPNERSVLTLYLKYLQECKKKYKNYGIDDVYLINSFVSDKTNWLMMYVNSLFPDLKLIVDNEGKLFNHLKVSLDFNKEFNKQYQILINNGQVEMFFKTEAKDMEHYSEYIQLLKYIQINIEKIQEIKLKTYKSKKQNFLIQGANMLISTLKNKNVHFDYYDLQNIISRAFNYNSLWHNQKLEEYLKTKN